MLVLYHANCSDGFCAAWILSKVYPDAEFVATDTGCTTVDLNGRDVMLVGNMYWIPYIREVIAKKAKSVAVFKNPMPTESYVGSKIPEYVHSDSERSVSRQVWDWVVEELNGGQFPDAPVWMFDYASRGTAPWLVEYVDDANMDRYVLPYSRAVNCALWSFPLTFDEWDRLHKFGWKRLVPDGEAILRYVEQQELRDPSSAEVWSDDDSVTLGPNAEPIE